MPTTQINQLPAGTAHVDAVVAADNVALTATQKIKLGDIAKLATDASQLTTGTLADARLSNNIVRTNDARLSDARTPVAHKSSHSTGGSDAIAPSDIGAQPAGSYATLVDGKVPSSQLPSYVDDVLEFANLAAFPEAGETGKIYVDLATGKTHRWSGSAYIEISASPGSTDAVPEGSTNLYHTSTRAAAAAPVQSVAGKTGAVVLGIADITGLQSALDNAGGGDSRWSLFLPPAPTNLTATPSSGSVALTWTAPSTLAQTPITDYSVQYKLSADSQWTTFSDGTSTSTSATVTGLTNGSAYTFRVAGVNGVGTGAYSSASSAVTPGSTPPIILSGNSSWLTGGSLNGTWSYAGEYNGKNYYSKQIQWSADGGSYDTLGYIYSGVESGWYISAQLGRTTQAGAGPSQILFCRKTGSESLSSTPVFSPWENVVAEGFIVTVLGT